MRLITWQRLGIIASVIWVVVGPTYFHLSKEDNDKRVARDQYQLPSTFPFITSQGGGAYQFQNECGDKTVGNWVPKQDWYWVERWNANRGMWARPSADCKTMEWQGGGRWERS
jgi:hypothetical protein